MKCLRYGANNGSIAVIKRKTKKYRWQFNGSGCDNKFNYDSRQFAFKLNSIILQAQIKTAIDVINIDTNAIEKKNFARKRTFYR